MTPTVPTPASTPAEGDISPTLDDLKAAQKEINGLSAKRADSDFQYDILFQKTLDGLLKEMARLDKRSGEKGRARELLKEIDDLDAAQKSRVDQDLVLLEKKTKLKQLNLDRILAINRKVSDQFQQAGDTTKVQELSDGTDFLKQMKGLLDQQLALDKALLQARVACDFTAAENIRKKQEDLKTQLQDLDKQMKTKLRVLEEESHGNPAWRPNLGDQENL
jgi:hypothetical protein